MYNSGNITWGKEKWHIDYNKVLLQSVSHFSFILNKCTHKNLRSVVTISVFIYVIFSKGSKAGALFESGGNKKPMEADAFKILSFNSYFWEHSYSYSKHL